VRSLYDGRLAVPMGKRTEVRVASAVEF
jgi:hypothetical protein